MDTQTGQYSNVLKALQGMQGSAQGLSYAQQSENYNTFSELMRKGVYLPDMLKRLDELESKVKTLETQPKHDANAELIAVMEASVKSDPEVKKARQKVADIKTAIISEMCMRDPRYADAVEEYKTTVNRVYIESREQDDREEIQAEDGAGAPEVCDDPCRGETHQESLSDVEKTRTLRARIGQISRSLIRQRVMVSAHSARTGRGTSSVVLFNRPIGSVECADSAEMP